MVASWCGTSRCVHLFDLILSVTNVALVIVSLQGASVGTPLAWHRVELQGKNIFGATNKGIFAFGLTGYTSSEETELTSPRSEVVAYADIRKCDKNIVSVTVQGQRNKFCNSCKETGIIVLSLMYITLMSAILSCVAITLRLTEAWKMAIDLRHNSDSISAGSSLYKWMSLAFSTFNLIFSISACGAWFHNCAVKIIENTGENRRIIPSWAEYYGHPSSGPCYRSIATVAVFATLIVVMEYLACSDPRCTPADRILRRFGMVQINANESNPLTNFGMDEEDDFEGENSVEVVRDNKHDEEQRQR
mmetsp:Transcript_16817/g.41378  ORF Transcript_16817/g.41378 Transcript_16817/m.41378 type:complete len:304 (+) Transcript_16817:98-1009(+)